MIDSHAFDLIDPYVRMMRLKKEICMSSGKWRDIDHVYTYIASGRAEFMIDGQRYYLQKGNAIIIPPYMTHMIVNTGNEPLVQYIIHFDMFEDEERKKLPHKDILEDTDRYLVRSRREDLLGGKVLVADVPESERNRVVNRYIEMTKEFHASKAGRERILKAECVVFLIDALRYQIDGLVKAGLNKTRSKAWIHIEKAIDYIQTCPNPEALDNASIAAAIEVSANYLTGVFQSHIGMSLHRYVINMKIEQARKLLLTGRMNVTEVASLTGFSSIHVFSKTFKSIIGVSPSQFMDEMVYKEHIEENVNEFLV